MHWPEQPCHICGYEGWHDEECLMYGTEWNYELGTYL